MKTLKKHKTDREIIKRSGAGIAILVLVLMVSLLAGCTDGLDIPLGNGKGNGNDGGGTPVTDNSQKAPPTKYSYADLMLGDLKPPFTQEKIKSIYGEPKVGKSIHLGDKPWVTWSYDDKVAFTFASEEAFSTFVDNAIIVEVSDNSISLPKNIKIGDSFESVLAKFPQEYDYKTREDGVFYGKLVYPGQTYVPVGLVRTDGPFAEYEGEAGRHEYGTFLELKKQIDKVLSVGDEKGGMSIAFKGDKAILVTMHLTLIEG